MDTSGGDFHIGGERSVGASTAVSTERLNIRFIFPRLLVRLIGLVLRQSVHYRCLLLAIAGSQTYDGPGSCTLRIPSEGRNVRIAKGVWRKRGSLVLSPTSLFDQDLLWQ